MGRRGRVLSEWVPIGINCVSWSCVLRFHKMQEISWLCEKYWLLKTDFASWSELVASVMAEVAPDFIQYNDKNTTNMWVLVH
jgi:hypothetical protein